METALLFAQNLTSAWIGAIISGMTLCSLLILFYLNRSWLHKYFGWFLLACVATEIAFAVFIVQIMNAHGEARHATYKAEVENTHKVQTTLAKHIIFSNDEIIVWFAGRGEYARDYASFFAQTRNTEKMPIFFSVKIPHSTYEDIDLRPSAPILLKVINLESDGLIPDLIIYALVTF